MDQMYNATFSSFITEGNGFEALYSNVYSQDLYSTIAAAYDLKPHARSVVFGEGTNHTFNFKSANPMGLNATQCKNSYYKPPFQVQLEEQWGAIGVDPKKINSMGPYIPTRTPVHPPVYILEESTTVAPAVGVTMVADPQTTGVEDDNHDIHTPSFPSTPLAMTIDLRACETWSISTRRSPDTSRGSMPSRGSPLASSISSGDDYDSLDDAEGESDHEDEYPEPPLRPIKSPSARAIRNMHRNERSPTVSSSSANGSSSFGEGSKPLDRKYPCPICPHVCKKLHDLRRHLLKTDHSPPSFKCKKCDKTFTRTDALKRHKGGRCKPT